MSGTLAWLAVLTGRLAMDKQDVDGQRAKLELRQFV